MLFPFKIAQFLREIALFHTNFNYKFSNLWSKFEGICTAFLPNFVLSLGLKVVVSHCLCYFVWSLWRMTSGEMLTSIFCRCEPIQSNLLKSYVHFLGQGPQPDAQTHQEASQDREWRPRGGRRLGGVLRLHLPGGRGRQTQPQAPGHGQNVEEAEGNRTTDTGMLTLALFNMG